MPPVRGDRRARRSVVDHEPEVDTRVVRLVAVAPRGELQAQRLVRGRFQRPPVEVADVLLRRCEGDRAAAFPAFRISDSAAQEDVAIALEIALPAFLRAGIALLRVAKTLTIASRGQWGARGAS